mmetsp:Transcript_9639/g.14166  ORF Transcript_9639/g.14166 Transcript_9639/m.14166 type:complete len:89 (+) Transcript_9639:108-374(+)
MSTDSFMNNVDCNVKQSARITATSLSSSIEARVRGNVNISLITATTLTPDSLNSRSASMESKLHHSILLGGFAHVGDYAGLLNRQSYF